MNNDINNEQDISPSESVSEFYSSEDTSYIISAQKNVEEYLRNKLQSNAVEESAKDLVKTNPTSSASEELIFSEDKAFIYYTALNFYKELIKQARRFNRAYCRLNGMILSGQRELKNKGKGQKYNKEFNPFLYKMYIRAKDGEEKKILTKDNTTPEEATLKVAYALGFLDSFEYKSIPSLFHIPTIEKILTDSRYLDTIRKEAQYTEEQKQIKEAYYVNKDRRDSWMEEVQNKLQEEVYKMKGAL